MTTRSKRFRYLALAVFLSIGAGMIWGIASGFSFGTLHSIIYSQGVYENLGYTHDGIPIIESYAKRNYEGKTYRTLDGKLVEISHRKTSGHWPYLAVPKGQPYSFSRPNWSRRISQLGGTNFENWFFVGDGNLHGHGYIVGYDEKSKEKIGYLDRNGFRSDEPPQEEQFPIDGRKCTDGSLFLWCDDGWQSRTTYLKTEDGLVYVNPKKRAVKLIRKETGWFSATVADNLQTDSKTLSDEETDSELILLRTSDRVRVLDPHGEEIQTYLLPEKLRNLTFALVPLQEGKALVRTGSHLFWIDTTGKILEHKVANLHNWRQISDTTESFFMSLCVPSIGMIGGTLFCYPWGLTRVGSDWSLGYGDAVSKGFQTWWPGMLFVTILGVVFAILCYRRQRKYGREWTWVWTGFVLLFGLPGYLGYLAHRRWPARLACPSCGELAPRDRETCFACSQNFPEPELKGTEVFA